MTEDEELSSFPTLSRDSEEPAIAAARFLAPGVGLDSQQLGHALRSSVRLVDSSRCHRAGLSCQWRVAAMVARSRRCSNQR
jgi:hypothetical protein